MKKKIVWLAICFAFLFAVTLLFAVKSGVFATIVPTKNGTDVFPSQRINVNAKDDFVCTLPLMVDIESVKSLLSSGMDVNAKDSGGRTLLLNVVQYRQGIDVARFLVSKGADVNAKTKGGTTPLYVAVENRDIEFVKFLVSKGADVSAKNNDGKTPQDLARAKNAIELIEYLSELSAQ